MLAISALVASFVVSATAASGGLRRPGLIPFPLTSGPEQVWINFGAKPDEMVIGWITSAKSESVVQYGPTVPYGFEAKGAAPKQYVFNNNVNQTTYTSGYIHSVTLSGLALRTRYHYRVGSTSSAWSQDFHFTTSPGVGADIPYVLGMVGDLGQTVDSNDTVYRLSQEADIDSLQIAGDLSYADNFQPRWDSWQRMVQPVSAYTPWMINAGNHEIEDASSVHFQAYQNRFTMPLMDKQPTTSRNLFYSYEVAGIHVINLCSFYDFIPGSEQYQFALDDIKKIDRSRTPWVVLVLHAPWYNSNEAHQGEGEAMRVIYEPIFHDVADFVFAGHVHAYERLGDGNSGCFKWKVEQNAPIYITIGDGGNREGIYNYWLDPPLACSSFRGAHFGSGKLITNATHAVWQWRRDDLPPGQNADSTVRVIPSLRDEQ